MKKLLTIVATLAVCICVQAQPVVINTNTSPPVLEGPFIDLLGSLSTATNWGIGTFGINVPATKQWGAGAVALYNISPFFATGVGIDWLHGKGGSSDQVTMPSGQIQFGAPFRIGGTNGIYLRPLGFTGVATPVSGMGPDNGTAIGLFGAGIEAKLYKGLHAFYAIEYRTGQPGPWNIFGIGYSLAF